MRQRPGSMNSKVVIIYCLLGAACVAINAEDDVDCSVQPEAIEGRTCCPIPEFFTKEITERCMEFHKPPKHHHHHYHHKKHDHHDHHVQHDHHDHHYPPHYNPCFLQCAFNETGIIDGDGNLDETKLQEYLAVVLEEVPELIPIMEESFRTCSVLAKNVTEDAPPLRSNRIEDPRCPTYGHKLIHCATIESNMNCPLSLWYATEECNEAHDFYEYCKSTINYWGKSFIRMTPPPTESN